MIRTELTAVSDEEILKRLLLLLDDRNTETPKH